VTACDSADNGSFEKAEPGVLVGPARVFTWSADGERLYHVVDEEIVREGGVITGSHYRIYKTTPGDSPRLIVEDSTDTFFGAVVSDLKAAGDVPYFFVRRAEPSDTSRILRWSSGEAASEAIVEDAFGAFDPREQVDNFSLSADRCYLAYYAGEGHRPDSFEIRVRDFDRGADICAGVVTSDYGGDPRDIPLLLSGDGSQLLFGLSAGGTAAGDKLTVVTYRLPAGIPRSTASFPR